MNKRYFLLSLLLFCFFFTTACSDSVKHRLYHTYVKLFESEQYKNYKAREALIDYVRARTKLDNDIVFIYDSDSYDRWEKYARTQTPSFLLKKQASLNENDVPDTALDDFYEFFSNALTRFEDSYEDPYDSYWNNNIHDGGNAYSGVYLCGPKNRNIIIAIPFSAVVINGEVKQFNEEWDDYKIKVFDLADYTVKTKAEYDAMFKIERGVNVVKNVLDGLFDLFFGK